MCSALYMTTLCADDKYPIVVVENDSEIYAELFIEIKNLIKQKKINYIQFKDISELKLLVHSEVKQDSLWLVSV